MRNLVSKIIHYDKMNKAVRVGSFDLCLSERSGSTYSFHRLCGHSFITFPPKHQRCYYFQVGRWGGYIMWDSGVCYEEVGQ